MMGSGRLHRALDALTVLCVLLLVALHPVHCASPATTAPSHATSSIRPLPSHVPAREVAIARYWSSPPPDCTPVSRALRVDLPIRQTPPAPPRGRVCRAPVTDAVIYATQRDVALAVIVRRNDSDHAPPAATRRAILQVYLV